MRLTAARESNIIDNNSLCITHPEGDVIRLVDIYGQTAAMYKYDPFGNAIYATGSHAQINPLRYRGYYFDSETGLYYLQSRYYDPQVGRFINADVYASTGQGILGCNMFAYCNNAPINNHDASGMWTFSFSFTTSAVCILGVSFSLGIAFDGHGNSELQYSYVVPGVDNTNTLGLFGAGFGVSFQFTNADTVSGLHGLATYVGASGGSLGYVGGDLVSFDDVSSSSMAVDGFQFVAGVGVGLDVHITESNTKPLLQPVPTPQKQKVDMREKRFNYCTRHVLLLQ